MGLLDKLRGTKTPGSDPTVVLDLPVRREQLRILEESIDALTQLMRSRGDLMANPGWRAKITEYDLVASEATRLRRSEPTREQILDVAFEVRPAVNPAHAAAGLDEVMVEQQKVLAAANALTELLPGERR